MDSAPICWVTAGPGVDPLTGLSNRRAFEVAVDRAAARAARGEPAGCVVMADIDGFKQVNDTHGHAAGDDVLVQIGRVLSEECRAADHIARVGGDEFFLLLPDTPFDEAEAVVNRLSATVAERVRLPGGGGVTLSFGIAPIGPRPDVFLGFADNAMYAAKVAGTGQVRVAERGQLAAIRAEIADLQREATRDELTGLANRRTFDREWARRHADGRCYGLLFVDVDHFHGYNRAHGMRAGDETLAVVASTLAEAVGERGRVYRYGGEEFVAVLDTTGDDVDVLGRDVVQAVRDLRRPHRRRRDGVEHVTVTAAGGTVDPARHEQAEAFDRVDATLTAAKERGRNRYA